MLTRSTTLAPRTVAAAFAIACVLASGPWAAAQVAVTSIGDISPFDSPFVPGDQGVPTTGTTVITTGVDALGQPVDIFGNPLTDEDGNLVGQFNYERSVNIQVGRFSTGQMFMTGGANLRFGDLIIGGAAPANVTANDLVIENGDFGTGSSSAVGTVEIVGAGTVYNNHPNVIPTQFQVPGGDPETTGFTVPETYNPGPDLGGVVGTSDLITNIRRGDDAFDLYVGLTGSGALQILEGGRGEIRDGAFIGIAPNAVGLVTVDGFGSYLGIYGNTNPFSEGNPDSQTIIGLHGTGTLEITDGGRVDSFNGAALGAADSDGDDAAGNLPGGRGEVIVQGTGSVWRVFGQDVTETEGTLAVGEYFDDGQQFASRISRLFVAPDDQDINDPQQGRGLLNVSDGGLVTVREDDLLTTNNDDAALRVGRLGEVQLRGGRVEVGGRFDNDGFVRTGDNRGGLDRYGDGEIDSGTFLNSPIGIVQVRGSERLTIRSTAELPEANMDTGGTTTFTYFMGNAGNIQVLGDQAIGKAELETQRATDLTPPTGAPESRFVNLRFAAVEGAGGVDAGGAPITADVRGQITAQDANLYFRSGLLNQADVLFVGGDSVVLGAVENEATGLVSLNNQSHVTFQDPVVNNGFITLNDESDITFGAGLSGAGALIDFNPATISVVGDFSTDGALEFVIGGGPNGMEATRMSVLGDATFGATSTLAIDAISLTGITAGSSFDLISITGDADLMDGDVVDNGLTTVALPTAPAGLAFIPDTNLLDGVYTLRVEAIAAPITGGDVNGDGMVDFADVQVWLMFNGLQTGATRQLGDVDGDGDVDPADLVIINMQLGMAPTPLPSFALTVPEPSALALLLFGGLAAVCRRGARR